LVFLFRKSEALRPNVDLFDWRVVKRRKARIDNLMIIHVTASYRRIDQARTALAEQTPSKFQFHMSSERVGVRKARTPKSSAHIAE
jgi:hypothetical protein